MNMYPVTITQTRPDVDTPFFGTSHPEAVALVASYVASFPGLTSMTTTFDASNLVQQTVMHFTDAQAYSDFRAGRSAQLMSSFVDARVAYNAAHGITMTVALPA
jgi:hypothetical protein